MGQAAKVGWQVVEKDIVQVELGEADQLGAALGYALERVNAGLEDGQLLALLDRLGDVGEDVPRDVEVGQLGQAGDRRRQTANLNNLNM